MHDKYKQIIKKIYYEECEIFWKDTKERYKKEFDDAKKLMMEKLDIVKKSDTARCNQPTNNETRKRKYSSDNKDVKPKSKP